MPTCLFSIIGLILISIITRKRQILCWQSSASLLLSEPKRSQPIWGNSGIQGLAVQWNIPRSIGRKIGLIGHWVWISAIRRQNTGISGIVWISLTRKIKTPVWTVIMTEEVLRLCGLYVLWESTRQTDRKFSWKKTVLIPILMIPKMRWKWVIPSRM